MEPEGECRWKKAERLVLLGAFLYGAVWMLSYGTSPMGMHPVLDGAETLRLAKAISSGEVPSEPFYRAPGYAAVLAVGYLIGVPDFWMPMVARFFNLACHLVTVVLVMRMSRRLWGQSLPGWGPAVTGALYGLFPVAIFFAADPLDITLGITLVMGAGDQLIRVRDERTVGREVRGGVLLGLACLVRPHFLVLLPLLVLRSAVIMVWEKGGAGRVFASPAMAGACLAVFGFVNLSVGGEFRVTPWQGSFNLWAANRTGSSGAWLTQRYEIPAGMETSNPARAEGEWAYRTATGTEGRIEIDAMNAWFKDRFIEEVKDDPFRVAGLLARKVGLLLYQHEQYNNKTYSFYAEREPLLGWNPLGWGVLLVLAGAGLAAGRVPGTVRGLVLTMAAFAGGVLIYYVSGRFRLPLVAPMAVLAAGSFRWFGEDAGQLRRWPVVGAVVVLGLLTFLDYGGFDRSERTSLEDRLLLASAALQTGQPAMAMEALGPVLEALPERQSALRMALVSQFEVDLERVRGRVAGDLETILVWYQGLNPPDPRFAPIVAVYWWRSGAREDAVTFLRKVQSGAEGDVGMEIRGLRAILGDLEAVDLEALESFLENGGVGRYAVAGGVVEGLLPLDEAAGRLGETPERLDRWLRRLFGFLEGD